MVVCHFILEALEVETMRIGGEVFLGGPVADFQGSGSVVNLPEDAQPPPGQALHTGNAAVVSSEAGLAPAVVLVTMLHQHPA